LPEVPAVYRYDFEALLAAGCVFWALFGLWAWWTGRLKPADPPPARAIPAGPAVGIAADGRPFARCPNCGGTTPLGTGDDYCPRCGWAAGAPF
jgi:hypothetical protein